jgi:hypothetical protein
MNNNFYAKNKGTGVLVQTPVTEGNVNRYDKLICIKLNSLWFVYHLLIFMFPSL